MADEKWHEYKGNGRTAPKQGTEVIVINYLLGNVNRCIAYWNGQTWMRDTIYGERGVDNVMFWRHKKEDPEELDQKVKDVQKQVSKTNITYG